MESKRIHSVPSKDENIESIKNDIDRINVEKIKLLNSFKGSDWRVDCNKIKKYYGLILTDIWTGKWGYCNECFESFQNGNFVKQILKLNDGLNEAYNIQLIEKDLQNGLEYYKLCSFFWEIK